MAIISGAFAADLKTTCECGLPILTMCFAAGAAAQPCRASVISRSLRKCRSGGGVVKRCLFDSPV